MEAVVEAKFLSPLPEDALLFRRMVAREELGRLPEYRIELLRESKLPTISAKDLLGAKAGIELWVDDHEYRYVSGFVTRFEHGGVSGRFDLYRVELRPWLWHLTLGSDCRIFQDKTAIEVIDAIFAEYSSAGAIEKKLNATYRSRPFTVQYRESDFDFVSRLMEEEGIYHYFKHSKGQHTLVLCDNPGAHVPMNGHGGELLFGTKKAGTQDQDNIVSRWSSTHVLGSLKYAHTDYAAEAPTTELKAEASRSTPYPSPNDLEVFDYPGGYDDIAMDAAKTATKITEGTRLAQRRIDAIESAHVSAQAVTSYRQVGVGMTFDLADHVDAGGFLITRADYEMEFDGYEAQSDREKTGFTCRFDAVPKAVHYQPPAVVKRPIISGPQTATVVGPAGDEITTDKYGRVKLQFRWDRVGTKNEKSSCWVRVSHPWASKQFGMIALPRVGDEVVVEFLEGNPDRPLVTGRVYNQDNMPPYVLPAQATVSGIKSQSSKGGSLDNFNELRFDDKKGSEYVWFQSEKDYHQLVKNDAFATVRNDLWTDVTKNAAHQIGENYTLTVGKQANLKVDADTYVKVGGDLTMAVVGALGLQVTDKIAIKGEAAVALAVGAGLDIDAGAALKMTAGATLHIKGLGIVIDGGTTLTIKAGPSFITLGPAGVVIEGPMVKINCGGAGGAANPALKAAPAVPKVPGEPKPNKDPLVP
jgi:type VI secretion system secreted protein VgrG